MFYEENKALACIWKNSFFNRANVGVWHQGLAQGYDFTYNTTLNGAEGLNLNLVNYFTGNTGYPPSNIGVIYTPSVGNFLVETYTGTPNAGVALSSIMCITSGLDLSIIPYQHYFNMDNVDITGYTNVSIKVPAPNAFGRYRAANISGSFPIDPEVNYVAIPNVVNRSPEFTDFPQVTANVNRPMNFSCAAFDRDGDSLVYRLRPIVPGVTYASGFSYLNPIPSSQPLTINPRTGMVSFTPVAFTPDSAATSPVNKYMIGIEVNKYRKLNGTVTKMGTIQRNLMVTVVNQLNYNPVVTLMQASQPLSPDSIIEVIAGTTLNLDFTIVDPDTLNRVSAYSDHQLILPNSTFTSKIIRRSSVSAQLTWTPTAADARQAPYYVNVVGRDDHCPYFGLGSTTIGVRVKSLTGIKEDKIRNTSFTAYPNPFTETVNFKLNWPNKAERILIYNLLGQQIDEILLKTVGSGEQKVQWQNASKYSAGTYVAKLISKDKTIQTLKFTKLH